MISQNNSLFQALGNLFEDPFKKEPDIIEFNYIETVTEALEAELSVNSLVSGISLLGMQVIVNPHLPKDKIYMVSPQVMNNLRNL